MALFHQTVSTEQELRELLGYPSRLVQNKVINRLGDVNVQLCVNRG